MAPAPFLDQEMAAKAKAEGAPGGDMLQLLHDISGAFRPGVLTALVGVSGAGKTTLMDVLADRKTGATCCCSLFDALLAGEHACLLLRLPCLLVVGGWCEAGSACVACTGGKITGDVRVDGHPKRAATFARICGMQMLAPTCCIKLGCSP